MKERTVSGGTGGTGAGQGKLEDGEPTPLRAGYLEDAGKEVYWELHGEGGREVVCLLNGLAMSTASWTSFLPRLTDAWDVLVFDYLGQGRSTSEDEAVTLPRLAGHLDGILDELELARLHVLGISYGGFVALEFARLFPHRLDTLTLSGILLSDEELFRMYQELSLAFYRGGTGLFDLYTRYMYEKIFGESFVRRAKVHLESMRSNFHDRYEHRVHSLIRLTEAQIPFFADLTANLPGYRAITAPTLVVAGAEDRVILPPVQRKICDILPDCRFEVIADSGHVVYLEQPEIFWGMLRRFLMAKSTAF